MKAEIYIMVKNPGAGLRLHRLTYEFIEWKDVVLKIMYIQTSISLSASMNFMTSLHIVNLKIKSDQVSIAQNIAPATPCLIDTVLTH